MMEEIASLCDKKGRFVVFKMYMGFVRGVRQVYVPREKFW